MGRGNVMQACADLRLFAQLQVKDHLMIRQLAKSPESRAYGSHRRSER